MAIKINLEKSIIPVEIGEFKFEVDLSDEKSKEFEANILQFLTGIKGLSGKFENEKELMGLMENVFDELLGEGAFGKLYGYTKRLDILAELLNELVIELIGKLPGRAELIREIKVKNQK